MDKLDSSEEAEVNTSELTEVVVLTISSSTPPTMEQIQDAIKDSTGGGAAEVADMVDNGDGTVTVVAKLERALENESFLQTLPTELGSTAVEPTDFTEEVVLTLAAPTTGQEPTVTEVQAAIRKASTGASIVEIASMNKNTDGTLTIVTKVAPARKSDIETMQDELRSDSSLETWKWFGFFFLK